MKQLRLIKDKKLRAVVRQYAKSNKKLAIPAKADGMCLDESLGFVAFAQRKLGRKRTEGMGELDIGKHPHYGKYCKERYDHFCVKFGRLRIDFTARQFHRNFAFPHIWIDTKKHDDFVKPSTCSDGYVY